MAEPGITPTTPDPNGPPQSALNVSLIVLGGAVLILLFSLLTRLLFPASDPAREDNPGHFVGQVLQVEVRNGCGVSGLASTMTTYLRRRGFDVVEVGDSPDFDQEFTMVYDRVGDLEAARKLAQAIGIPEERVVQDINPEEFLDASVVIGNDYATLKPFQE
ncbi:MAG: LytR C-terminal domain-containing protein [Rhodothermales bacterium]|nr:LytR C-terminal domain-containing protein [Rhodothermales bacterium]